MEERSVQIFISYERSFSLVFWEDEWLVGATPSTWNFGSTGPRWSKIADFQPIIARSASAVTPSEKSSINANKKSTTRFPMSLRWSSYVAPKSEWPSTFGVRPLGDRHLSRFRPSSRPILGQFVSLLVSARRLAQLPVRAVWFTLLGEFC